MKKKIIFILSAILLANKIYSTSITITGSVEVCANTTTNYKVGYPSGASNFYYGELSAAGGNPTTTTPGTDFSVKWDNYICTEEIYVEIKNIQYDIGLTHYTEAGPIRLNITAKRLGPISTISGNATPAICSTSELTYSIPAVCKAQNYSWSIPSGWTVNPSTPLSGVNATTIKLTPTAAGSGVVKVTASYNPNGGCALTAAASLIITRPAQSPVFTTTTTVYCTLNTPSAQFCVSNVPNASGYSWTYPSGWTGPTTTSTPCATVNFNGVIKTGNICCASILCGTTSQATCLSVTTQNTIPNTNGISWDFPTYSSSTTTPAKKTVTVYFGSYYTNVDKYTLNSSGNYYFVNRVTNESQGSPSVHSVSTMMFTNEIITVIGYNKNLCGRSIDVQRSYKVINDHLEEVQFELPRVATDVNENSENDYKIFPNPASTTITVTAGNLLEQSTSISLYDILGKRVKEILHISDKTSNINVSDLQNGIYFIQIQNEHGIIRKEKIVITH